MENFRSSLVALMTPSRCSDLDGGQAGHGLVEQDQRRHRGQAHGDLEQPPVGKRQVRRLDVPLGGQLDELESLQSPLLGALPWCLPP